MSDNLNNQYVSEPRVASRELWTRNSRLVFLLTTVCCLLFTEFIRAQDPNFSQFEMNPLYYNPANAGNVTDLRFGINYRNLWFNVPGMKFPGPLSTYNFYMDKQFSNALIGGLGAFVYQDFEGEGFLRNTAGGFIYSWRMPTKQNNYFMSFGTKIYINQLKIDWSRLIFSDQVNPNGYTYASSAFMPQNDGKKIYFDIDAGMTFGFNVFQNKADEQKWTNEFSFAVAHLVKPDISLNDIESQLPMKFTVMYNTSFPISKNKLYINPKILFEKQEGYTHAYTYGFNMYVVKRHPFESAFSRFYFTKPLYLGFYFRNPKLNDMKNTKSLIFVAGHTGKFPSSDTRYQLGVSYDFTIGGLNLSTWGALEVSATIILATKSISKKYTRYCPKFSTSPMSPMN